MRFSTQLSLFFGAMLATASLSSALDSKPAQTTKASTPAATPVMSGDRWGADYFPNCELKAHNGQSLRFFDDMMKDKIVLVNFIYTSCPDACPLASAKLAEVYEVLKERMGKDVFFYSISVDPEVDTPEVLAEYAKRFGAGPGWLFLTGKKDDIRSVRKKMGMLRANEESLSEHTLDMMIGNQAKGVWLKRSTMDNPYAIAEQLANKASGWKLPPKKDAQVEMPILRNYEAGEDIFRTRCSACHVIGQDDGLPKQGPNLIGVVDRRDRKWLERWITEPDVMLALKDPIAMDLYHAWRELPMPNMKLTPPEVRDVIEYIDRTSDAYVAELKRKEDLAKADWAIADTSSAHEEDADAKVEVRGGCCEKTDGLIGDEAEIEVPVEEAPVEAAKPSCCQKTDGLIGDEPEAEEVADCCREEVPEEERPEAPKPTPYLGSAVMALVGVGLLGLLRLGRKAA